MHWFVGVQSFFVFNEPPSRQSYTLSLHDALPICTHTVTGNDGGKTGTASLSINAGPLDHLALAPASATDRKSTRLNSSHRCISYAVFCLKKKKHNRRARLSYFDGV